jgi:hypothetical protein
LFEIDILFKASYLQGTDSSPQLSLIALDMSAYSPITAMSIPTEMILFWMNTNSSGTPGPNISNSFSGAKHNASAFDYYATNLPQH